jgi:eukaryotic-like serine/threonine-protein kinase
VSEAAALPAESRLFLGRYRAVRPLGTGGSGSVWLAHDERSGREVAIKVVPREGKAGSRARREAQAMARLRHPACLRAYACGRDAENVYIAYEYVPGRTFREALRSGKVTDDVAVEAAVQVLEALAHAHGHGIVHRDVKPANVLLADGDGVSARLLDFGLARFADSETLTGAGDVPGTLAYIAPERLRGEVAGEAGDVWSVGVLLYEALSGRHPFWRSSLAESAEAIASGAPPLHVERPDLPEPLLAAVDRALALDPSKRPSAAKLARTLRSARGERPLKARDWAPTLERRLLPALLAAVYAAGGAALLPFYPPHAVPVLAVVAAAVAALAPRWGLALALAVPVFPLGNVALGLALVYAAAALVWLAVAAREPERGLLPAVAPLTGPLAPVVVPLALFSTRSPLRRALGAAAGIVLAEVVHAVRAGPIGLGIPGSRHPEAVAAVLARAAPHALVFELPIVAAVAVLLPIAVRRRNDFARAAARLRPGRRNTPEAEARAYTR